MSERPLRRLASKPALRVEEIEQVLNQIRVASSDLADHLADATRVEPSDKRFDSDLPDLSERADNALRAWLEDETVALVEPDGPKGIDEHELHNELMKKALVGLKRGVLQEIAASKNLVPESRLDELARQVARAYDWDESAIARLVLDYTEEPLETQGGLSTRIFTLDRPPDLNYIAERLEYVDGRYYRTDIAKWFVVNRYRRVGSVLRIDGTLQSYKATVDPAVEDRLATEQDITACELEVRDGVRTILIHQAKTHGTARSMLAAFKVATQEEAKDYVPNVGDNATVVPRHLHPSTLFLLDVITHRMRGHLFRSRNPILARFRLGTRAEGRLESPSSRKPSLRAVRFEGENLLDSPTACGLMWTEGRPLVDVTLSVAATKSETDSTILARVPIRLALERDAVLVQTGLTDELATTSQVHRAVVAHVEAAIKQPVSGDREARLERTIKAQAQHPDPEADARLLDDDLGSDMETI